MELNEAFVINSIDDVKRFARHLYAEEKCVVHCDEDFFDYIDTDTKRPSFTEEKAARYNRLMADCFAVCKTNGCDIYETFMAESNAVGAVAY
mgnify:CR=1 FL=1